MGRARATFATGRIAISPTMLKRHGTAIAAIDRTRTSKIRNFGWMGKCTFVLLRPAGKEFPKHIVTYLSSNNNREPD